MYILFNRDIELSCDESVVRHFGENAKAVYARTLITMEEKKSGSLKNGKHLKGVVCDVKNCSFHDGDSCCTANRIAVGPSFASTSGETVCATFKPKML